MNTSATSGTTRKDEFIYVGDVMCSWCWGFAPTLHRLERAFGLPVRVVNGGLRPGPHAQVLDDEMASYLGNHWEKVAEASGQPFDSSFLDRRDGWRFDSEMPAIAVAAMRGYGQELGLPFFSDIQHAFFADGVDVTDPHQYAPLLTDYPVEPAAFLDYLLHADAKKAAWKDFEEARSLGISSLPGPALEPRWHDGDGYPRLDAVRATGRTTAGLLRGVRLRGGRGPPLLRRKEVLSPQGR